METGKANLGGDNDRYSNIDLENVESWLPPEVARSLSRMIAVRNRKQLEDSIAASSCAIDLDALDVEREALPAVDGDHHVLSKSEFLTLDCAETSEVGMSEAVVIPDSQVDGEIVEGGGELDDSLGDGIPFF